MVFSYYSKLSAARKCVYQKSDGIHAVLLPDAARLQPLIPRLAWSLEQEDRKNAEEISAALLTGLADRLGVPRIRLRVLAVRPSTAGGELHGLYELEEGRDAVVTLWMRTAKHKRVVAFRSFLRTLLHEFCHHLDYHLYRLPDSYHTEGFYKRESSLFHQLMTEL